MTDSQKQYAALLALAVVSVGVAMLIALTAALIGGLLTGDSALGATFLDLLVTFKTSQLIFGPIGVIVTVGLGIAGAAETPTRWTKLSGAALLLGLLCCSIITIWLADGDVAGLLWSRTNDTQLDSFEKLQTASNTFVLWAASGLAAGLAALLGISLAKRAKQ